MKNSFYNRNNRAVVGENGYVRQVTIYYSFGGVFSTTAYNSGDDLQPYKYNGKELDRTHGLDWYDYGARNYDAFLPVFTSIDPLCEKYYHISPYAYCANNPENYVDLHGDSITIDAQAILAIYNGLEAGSNIHMDFNNGVLDPSSISDAVSSSDDFFLHDLYEIAINPQMVELKVSNNNEYILDGVKQTPEWDTPYELDDYDLDMTAQLMLKEMGQPLGKHVQGNTGQTLYPNSGLRRSTNGNIQVIINGKGNINIQTVGIAYEFGHVILHLRGLPSGHGQPGVDPFVYGKATLMSKRLGYDY